MLRVGWIVGHCGMFDVSRENVSKELLSAHCNCQSNAKDKFLS